MDTSTSHPSAATRAYDHLKRAILEGTHPGGTLLTEGDVAERLGVSRTPVREALLRLESEGLVRLYPKKGALVVPVSAQEAHDVVEARALIEEWAAERAWPRRAEIAPELELLLEEMRRARQADAFLDFTTADRCLPRAGRRRGRQRAADPLLPGAARAAAVHLHRRDAHVPAPDGRRGGRPRSSCWRRCAARTRRSSSPSPGPTSTSPATWRGWADEPAPRPRASAPATPPSSTRSAGRRAWAVWAAAIAVYVLAVFHRTSLGVAGLVAAERFHISSAQLATFTMVQLFVYAGMQIPVGAILDRVGSRVMLITGVALMSCAQLGFAFAGTFAEGIVARVFVGMGDAMVFISLLRLVALWFPPGRTAMITQVTGVLGQLGALASAAPLALALSAWGWTPSFATAAAVGVVLGLVLVLVVRDSPYASHHREELKVRARRPGGAAGLGRAGHPARPLVALLGAVRVQRLRAAVGLPVPRLGPGAVHRHGERAADADDGGHGDRQPDRRHVRDALAVLALDPRALDRRARSCWRGPSCCCGRAGRRCRCWSCSSS